MPCLIFDVDDTLVEYVDFDFEEWYKQVAKKAADALGIPLDIDVWRGMISGVVSRRYPEKFGIPAVEFWRKVDENNLEYRKRMLSTRRLRVYPDAYFIRDLPGKKIAWSASSEACIRFVLDAIGLLGEFQAIYGKDFENYAFLDEMKPKSGFLRQIITREGCDGCIVVGDSLRDMKAAEGAGCVGILVDRRGDAKYGRKIASLEELKSLIR